MKLSSFFLFVVGYLWGKFIDVLPVQQVTLKIQDIACSFAKFFSYKLDLRRTVYNMPGSCFLWSEFFRVRTESEGHFLNNAAIKYTCQRIRILSYFMQWCMMISLILLDFWSHLFILTHFRQMFSFYCPCFQGVKSGNIDKNRSGNALT